MSCPSPPLPPGPLWLALLALPRLYPVHPLGGHLGRSRQEPGGAIQEILPRLALQTSLKNGPHA